MNSTPINAAPMNATPMNSSSQHADQPGSGRFTSVATISTVTPRQVLQRCRLMPVVCIDNANHAVPLANALLEGGINVIEITLRTPAALAAIEAIAAAVPDMWVGAGTLVRPEQINAIAQAGARFVLSPGATPAIHEAVRVQGMPFIPGVATASDIMLAMAAGLDAFKFFPAQSMGGVATLQAFAGPFADALFCPTGGIKPETAANFLSLDNVACVGGSWLTPAALLREQQWSAISALARQSLALLDGPVE